jgi:hypothetical protein
MKRDVWWMPDASKRLAKIWVDADAEMQRAITRGVDNLEESLRRNPEIIGESRGPFARVAVIGPIGVEFNLFLDGKLIRITRVWEIRRGKSKG